MYIKPAQSLTQSCVGQHMFHSQNKNHNKRTDVCFRNLPAPTGKILAVATGVTAGPANLGRMTSCFAEFLLRMLFFSAEKKLTGLTGGTRFFSSPMKQRGTVFSHQLNKKNDIGKHYFDIDPCRTLGPFRRW